MVGAGNAMAAYHLYGGKVTDKPLRVLVYMALVSLDNDERPWWAQRGGHKALAEFALRRPTPITESDLRAVRRAITPLLAVKAIKVDRRPAPRGDEDDTVRYLLNLHDAGRKTSGVDSLEASVDGDQRRTKSGRDVGRKVVGRRTKSGRTPDEKWSPNKEEEEEEEEERGEEEGVTSPAQVQTAREDNEPTEEIDLAEEKPSGDHAVCRRCGAYLDPDGSCFACTTRNHR